MKANKQIKQKIISSNGLVIILEVITSTEIRLIKRVIPWKCEKNLHGEIIFAGQA